MPAFHELLAQLSSEYDRVENALALALGEPPARRGQLVGVGALASKIPCGPPAPSRAVRSHSPAVTTAQRNLGAQDSGQWHPAQFEDSPEEEEDEQGEVCKRRRGWLRERTRTLERVAEEEEPGDSVLGISAANPRLPSPAVDPSVSGSRFQNFATSERTQDASLSPLGNFGPRTLTPSSRKAMAAQARASIEAEEGRLVGRRLSIREFQMAESRWVVNPEHSPALEKWDQITLLALAYVALVTPVQVTMLDSKLDALLFINCFMDLIFGFDMILQFFLMYPVRKNGVLSLEHRHRRIVSHYLKTWFVIDILSTVPFDLMAALSDSEQASQLKVVKTVRLMRLLKLVRVLKASRVLHRFETRMSISYGRFALLKFFIILFVITHWLANLWALTLVIVDEHDGVPRWVDVLTDMEAHVEFKTKDSPAKLYITCLYFTSYTITSVGYGDIAPKNITERVILTFIIMLSGISWAVVLGQVCGIVTHLDKDEQTFRSTMDELNALMQERMIPGHMRMRLRSFFLSTKVAQRRARHQDILSVMSPGLRAEVSWEINRLWLDKVKFLKAIIAEAELHHNQGYSQSMREFVLDVSLIMELVVRAQNEVFGVPHTMYILNRGLVGWLARVFRMGSVWGADFVLSEHRLLAGVRRMALTYVEASAVSREQFFNVVRRHCERFPQIEKAVRRHCCWLAFQRAFLIEARRRRGVLRGQSWETVAPLF